MILYFSGTGNSLYAARKLLDEGEKLLISSPNGGENMDNKIIIRLFSPFGGGKCPVVNRYGKTMKSV